MRKILALAVLTANLAAPALAALPAPTKPVPQSFFTGRWYEIARSPNDRQQGCEAPLYQFAPKSSGGLAFSLICHKDAPNGRAVTTNATIRMDEGDDHNRFKVQALGGLASLDYWVLDRADNGDWWILATPKKPRIWLLARRPDLSGRDRAEALERMKAMGYAQGALIFPQQG